MAYISVCFVTSKSKNFLRKFLDFFLFFYNETSISDQIRVELKFYCTGGIYNERNDD